MGWRNWYCFLLFSLRYSGGQWPLSKSIAEVTVLNFGGLAECCYGGEVLHLAGLLPASVVLSFPMLGWHGICGTREKNSFLKILCVD